MSKGLNFRFDMALKRLSHFFIIARRPLRCLFCLDEKEGLQSPDFLNFVKHLGRVLEQDKFLIQQREKRHQKCLVGVLEHSLSEYRW